MLRLKEDSRITDAPEFVSMNRFEMSGPVIHFL